MNVNYRNIFCNCIKLHQIVNAFYKGKIWNLLYQGYQYSLCYDRYIISISTRWRQNVFVLHLSTQNRLPVSHSITECGSSLENIPSIGGAYRDLKSILTWNAVFFKRSFCVSFKISFRWLHITMSAMCELQVFPLFGNFPIEASTFSSGCNSIREAFNEKVIYTEIKLRNQRKSYPEPAEMCPSYVLRFWQRFDEQIRVYVSKCSIALWDHARICCT